MRACVYGGDEEPIEPVCKDIEENEGEIDFDLLQSACRHREGRPPDFFQQHFQRGDFSHWVFLVLVDCCEFFYW